MSKTYTLAEIAAYHMDAVREGLVRWGGAILTIKAGRLALVSFEGRWLGLELDGYTIEKPKVVEVRRGGPVAVERWGVCSFPGYEALLAFVDAFDQHDNNIQTDPLTSWMQVRNARDRFKVVD